jgi:hypothetical protein
LFSSSAASILLSACKIHRQLHKGFSILIVLDVGAPWAEAARLDIWKPVETGWRVKDLGILPTFIMSIPAKDGGYPFKGRGIWFWEPDFRPKKFHSKS